MVDAALKTIKKTVKWVTINYLDSLQLSCGGELTQFISTGSNCGVIRYLPFVITKVIQLEIYMIFRNVTRRYWTELIKKVKLNLEYREILIYNEI